MGEGIETVVGLDNVCILLVIQEMFKLTMVKELVLKTESQERKAVSFVCRLGMQDPTAL